MMIFSQEFWRHRKPLNIALLPAAVLFGVFAAGRRKMYAGGALKSAAVSVPVIVVGNIVVGGGGKTPIVCALVQELQQRGFSPGIASGGAGGEFSGVLSVNEKTSWRQCGDEPLLLARRTGALVCVGKKRVQAAQTLAAQGCDIIVCDDGLQHYALRRNLEICAVHADFGLGNGWRLPAGPLRESRHRLADCDWLAISAMSDTTPPQTMANLSHPQTARVVLSAAGFYALNNPNTAKTAPDFVGKKIAAIAAIAAPQRFFDSLNAAGITVHSAHPLPDHARMDDDKLAALDADIILMTEKDAVKYNAADSRLHAMRLVARLPSALVEAAAKTAKNGKLA